MRNWRGSIQLEPSPVQTDPVNPALLIAGSVTLIVVALVLLALIVMEFTERRR